MARDETLQTGTVYDDECDSTAGSRPGCGIGSNSNVSYGRNFNAASGGVFAALWDGDGFKVCE